MEKPARFCRRDMYMHFFYELKESSMEIEKKTSVHVPPHLHRSLECIFVTSGTLELGIGTELFHMNTGSSRQLPVPDFLLFQETIASCFHFPLLKRSRKQTERATQSIIMATQTPNTPIPKYCPRI